MSDQGSDKSAGKEFSGVASPQEPVSKVQINKLEASRPKPQPSLDHTPSGDEWNELYLEAQRHKNKQITKQVNRMRSRLDDFGGRCKRDFKRVRGRSKDRDDGRSR